MSLKMVRSREERISEITERLKHPENVAYIEEAISHENRLRLHAETLLDGDLGQTTSGFLSWVESILDNKDAFNSFRSMFRSPVDTNALCDEMKRELHKVFNGKNPSNSLSIEKLTDKLDYEAYSAENPDIERWKSEFFDLYLSRPNTILAVDLPAEITTGKAKPYVFPIFISNVISICVDDHGNINFLAYYSHDADIDGEKVKVYNVMDEWGYYQFYKIKESYVYNNVGDDHELGYNPATFISKEYLNPTDKIVRKSKFSAVISKLDWLLFRSIGRKNLDLYASYPIYVTYEQDCSYADESAGHVCDGGFLRDLHTDEWVFDGIMPAKCPHCASRNLTGPGSRVVLTPPGPDEAAIDKPVQIVSVDRQSLDYNKADIASLEEEIFRKVVGYDGDVLAEEAINEDQVKSSFESKNNVLNKIRISIEHALEFVQDTKIRLRYRYKKDQFSGSTVSLGSEFYTRSAAELRKEYSDAKAAGASEAELSIISRDIAKSTYSDNPEKLNRLQILSLLEPYPNMSIKEVLDIKDIVPEQDLQIKINFTTFVDAFESEYIDIQDFGKNMKLHLKVAKLKEIFRKYADEVIKRLPAVEEDKKEDAPE